MSWHYFSDAEQQAVGLASAIADDLIRLLQQQERVTLCLPGGTTPTLFFNHISKIDLDWSRVHLVLSDERWVPLHDPLSNEALLREHFARNLASTVRIIPLYDNALPIADAVIQFNQNISPTLTIDICVLGMGEDGHTASLFPDMAGLVDALDNRYEPSLVVANVPNKQEQRVSWNVSALLAASKHYVLIKGKFKQTVAVEAEKTLSLNLPISYVFNTKAVDIYYAEH